MDYNAFNGPKLTPEQMAAYLERIGLSEPVSLDLEGLTKVQKAHQQSVPFDNLDIMAGRPLSLAHEDLFYKIVTRRQGGVCSEINTIYNWLLYSLGFDVTSYNSRIAYPDPVQFRRHRLMGVKLDGKTYITDAGSNLEFARTPLLLEADIIQSDGVAEYRLLWDEHFGWLYQQRRPGEADFHDFHLFNEDPQIDLDFMAPLFYFEAHPDSNMKTFPRASIYTEDQFIAIRNHSFLVERGDVRISTQPIEDFEEEKRMLREIFHLDTTGL